MDGGNPANLPPTPSANTTFNMVNADSVALGGTGASRNAPAPWVPFARAGCDVGNVGTANAVLENNNSIIFRTSPTPLPSPNVFATDPTGDMTKVFGEGSPEWNEGRDSQLAASGTAARTLAQTDFVGIAIHCGAAGGICKNNAKATSDVLPDEVGGYAGYKALFGAKYVNPAITQDAAHPAGTPFVNDTKGAPIADPFGQYGFPGFDGMFARSTLGYVAQMQEAGVPVTFAYISDAHDNHGNSGNIHIAYGPGEAGYVQQLRDYDAAFGDFFARLKNDGITKKNTLFVFTVEEGDHFAGTAPDAPCDGVTTPCTYTSPGHHVSEVNGDLKKLVATYNAIHNTNATTGFSVHSDMAPNVYITGNPARGSVDARNLEKAMSAMVVTNPLSGVRQPLFVAMADPVQEKTLHMVTPDPARTPTFTPFAQGDYFLNASSNVPCAGNNLDNCLFIPAPSNFTFAWNHGGIQPEVATTWTGIVGPGVQRKHVDDKVWSDHTDIRPTMLALLGLRDTYVSDGRVLTDILQDHAVTRSLRGDGTVERLGAAYKQVNAPFGRFAMDTLIASTAALASDSPGDSTYAGIENRILSLTADRDVLAGKIRAALHRAEFEGHEISKGQAKTWINQANRLLHAAQELAASS